MEGPYLYESAGLPIGVEWLPDETLYSLCARVHTLWGFPWQHHVSSRLFGKRRKGVAHDFPSSLAKFVERTNGMLGTAQNIAQQRTLLPYYLAFKTPFVGKKALGLMMGAGQSGDVKSALGIAASGFRAHHPLKACPACMADDQAAGVPTYWRRSHQFPGVNLCPTHGTSLQTTPQKTDGTKRFDWLLPSDCEFSGPGCGGDLIHDEPSHKLQRALAKAAATLGERSTEMPFQAQQLVATYSMGLNAKGLLRPGGSIRRNESVDSLLQFSRWLPVDLLGSVAVASQNEAVSLLSRCRDPVRVLTHPLRHLLLALWLFEDWTHFLAAYDNAESLGEGSVTKSPPKVAVGNETLNGSNAKLVLGQLLTGQRLSVSAAAKSLGITVNTAMAWSAQLGIPFKRRAKSVTEPLRSLLIKALGKGADKTELAQQHSVSIQTVTRLLRTEVGLYGQWKVAQSDASLASRRRCLQKTVARHQGLTPSLIRGLIPAHYAWLYKNDREWLQEQLDQLSRADRTHRSGVDWDRRDTGFARAVEKAMGQLQAQGEEKPRELNLRALLEKVPELAPKMRNLHRLPRTAKAIECALRAQATSNPPLL